jgi:hypothetical protein
VRCGNVGSWQILLQKSFSTADKNFSSPLMRFVNMWRTSSLREKLTGGFANGLGAILIGEHSLASFLSKETPPSNFGLLQQYRHIPDIGCHDVMSAAGESRH